MIAHLSEMQATIQAEVKALMPKLLDNV